jgi:cytochrome c553
LALKQNSNLDKEGRLMNIPNTFFRLMFLLMCFAAAAAQAASLSPTTLRLLTGQTGSIKVSNIKGTATLTNSSPSVVTASLSSGKITIKALTPGSATLYVKDNKGTVSAKVNVKDPMTLSQDSLSLTVNQKATVTISNASGTVTVTSSDPSKVIASLSSYTITVTGMAIGNATLTVKDSKTTRTLPVTVTAASSTNIGTVKGTTAGRLLASNCFQCHGTYGSGGFDKLIGMSPTEMADELTEFTSGGEHADSIMAAHLRGYTDEQLNLIAAYLANP